MNKEQRRRGVGTHGRGGRFLICSRALIVGPVPYFCAFPLVIVVLTNAPPQTLTITLRTTHAPPHSFFRACVSIVTEAALREMRFPGLLAVCFPVLGTSLSGTSPASLTCIYGCVLWEGCVASIHIYLLCFRMRTDVTLHGTHEFNQQLGARSGYSVRTRIALCLGPRCSPVSSCSPPSLGSCSPCFSTT